MSRTDDPLPQHAIAQMEQMRPPLLCVTDGHAGNRRQAEALAHALGWTEAPHVTLAPSGWAGLLAPRRFPGAAGALGTAFARTLAHPPELVIGCGRQAALATRLLRRAGSRAIQILDPRIDARHWDRVIVPMHDGLGGDNVILMQGSLNDVDDLWLAQARHDFPRLADIPGPRVALLVGGPSKHWAMDDAAFRIALTHLVDAVKAQGGSLLVTASRRTPDPWRAMLRSSGAALAWGDDRDGANPYRGLLGWADAIVCTADSVNMLSEACATTAPVHVIGGERLQGRPRRFLDAMQASGRVRPALGGLAPFPVTPLRETARVAELLQAWLETPRAAPA